MKQKSESQTNAIWAVNVKYALNISLPTVYHKQTSKMTNKWGTQCSKHTVDVSLEIKGNPVIRLLFRLIVEAHLF